MYVEERIYRLKIGAVAEYCKNYEELGMKTQLKHLPHMVGYYFTEIGGLKCMVHLWAYDSLDQREKCRAAMQADPDWKKYLDKSRPLMESQENRIMKAAPFFVERLKKMLAAAK
jgi:NIPSNAP protein